MNTAIMYSLVWNDSEPSWVVIEQTEDYADLQIVFGSDRSSLSDVKALRTLDQTQADSPLSVVLVLVKGRTTLLLATRESATANLGLT